MTIKHRAQLLLTSGSLSREDLADRLSCAADDIKAIAEEAGDKLEVFVIDDMEDEDS